MRPEEAMELLESRLRRLRSKLARNDALFGLLMSLAGSLGLLLLFLFVSILFSIPGGLAFTMIIGLGLSLLGWLCLRPLLFGRAIEAVALNVESKFPGFKNTLISSIQLWDKRRGNKEGYSKELIEEVALEAWRLSKELDFEEIVERRKVTVAGRLFSAALACFFFWASLSPATLYPPLWRLLNPGAEPFQTVLKVKPGDVSVKKGGDVLIEAKIYGRVLRRLTLHLEDRELSMTRAESDLFSHSVTGIERGFVYWVEGRGVRSEAYEVEVVESPVISELNLKYLYPSYTGLPPVEVKGRGDVTALVGTRVLVRGESTRELRSASLVFDDTLGVPLEVAEKSFQGDFTIKRDGSYRIEIEDSLGNRNLRPIEYRISSIPDDAPVVRIEEPGRDINLPRSMVVGLFIYAADDFGLTTVLLKYEREEGRRVPITDLKGERVEANLDYSWDLSALGLLPGDVVTYWVEVYDNDTYIGPKRGVSRTHKVRFPTLEEIYREVAQGQEVIAEEIGTILPEQEELSEKLEELSQELRKTRELSWEERRAAEEVVEKQKEIAKKIRDVLDTLDETLKSMENSIVMDEETVEKMMEVRRLLEEVETDEIRSAMEKLREALRSLKQEEIQKAMRELNLTQEELKRRLERTLEILERLRQEQRLKALAEKAEELLRKQKEIRSETEEASGEELEKLSEREEELRRETEEMRAEMEKLAQELRESDPEVSESLDSLSKSMEEGGLCSKQSNCSGSLCKGERAKAMRLEEDIIQQLSQLSTGLSSALSQMTAGRKGEIEEAMRKAAGDLVFLSKKQEELTGSISRGKESPSLDPRSLARTEQSLRGGLRMVTEDLYQASQKSFFITPEVGRALSSSMSAMEQAQKSLEAGNVPAAENASKEGVKSLNLAIEQLFKCQSQLSASCSAGGLEQALGKLAGLAGEQMAINKGVQGLLPLNLQGGRLSMEARAQLGRLASEQASIAERLNKIAEGIGERSDLLGDLARLAEEMEEIAGELERSDKIDRKLVQRQQRILSRLLDAQRSLHRRDSSQRRRAEVGEDIPGLRSPPELPEELREPSPREDLLKALREKYPREYERLIRAYFKALSEGY